MFKFDFDLEEEDIDNELTTSPHPADSPDSSKQAEKISSLKPFEELSLPSLVSSERLFSFI